MSDFQRARSDEQKSQRMADIKKATAELFDAYPYHEITLTTIAERLGWSRANLSKYVATKEEIFLELSADARDAYFNALLDAFPKGSSFDAKEGARIWAKVAAEHQDWPLFGTMLMTIIEANVTVERLKVFKKGYYDQLAVLTSQLSDALGVSKKDFASLLNTVYYHQTGLAGNCAHNPLVAQALDELGIDRRLPDYQEEMERFIRMCLESWRK